MAWSRGPVLTIIRQLIPRPRRMEEIGRRRAARAETEPTINSPIIALTRNWADLPLETLWESSRPRHWRQFTDCINRLIVPLRRGSLLHSVYRSIRIVLLFLFIYFSQKSILLSLYSILIFAQILIYLDFYHSGTTFAFENSKHFSPTFQEVLLLPPNPFVPSSEMPWIFKDLRTLPRRSTDRCIPPPDPDHPRIPRPPRFCAQGEDGANSINGII